MTVSATSSQDWTAVCQGASTRQATNNQPVTPAPTDSVQLSETAASQLHA